MLITVSGLLYIAATRWYRRKGRPASSSGNNLFAEVWQEVRQAQANRQLARQKLGGTEQVPSNWLDYYFDTHRCELDPKCKALQQGADSRVMKCDKHHVVDDIKSAIRVSTMLIPISVFFALYFQNFSMALFQALLMDYRLPWIGPTALLLPGQIMLVSPALLLILIPLNG